MRWQRAVDRALEPLELTHTQYWVLATAAWCIDEADDAVSQQEIAYAAELDKATTSFVLRKLEDRGLVSRGPTGEGRAALRVVVTKSGYRTLAEAGPKVAAAARSLARE